MRALVYVIGVVVIAVVSGASAPGQEEGVARELRAFPEAGEGERRVVLFVPKKEDEASLKVQVIVGKTVETDGVNRYFFGGEIEAVEVEGWGYTRHVVRGLGPMGGTLIGVDPAAPKMEQFVKIGGEPFLVRYNSRLPVVVYVPQDAEVRFRIWEAGEEILGVDR
jgi:ecotin